MGKNLDAFTQYHHHDESHIYSLTHATVMTNAKVKWKHRELEQNATDK